MACIFKRGKTWSYSVDLGRDDTGKRRKKGKGGFRTQKEAKEAAALLEVDIAGGTFVDEKKITFGELAEQWLEEHSKGIKPTTLLNYAYCSNKLNDILGKHFIKDITKIQYQKTLELLFREINSRHTLQSINKVAKMIFNYACKYDLLKSNPTAYAKVPKFKETVANIKSNPDLPKYLEKEDLKIFLNSIKHNEKYNSYAIFLTLAYTGIRRSELAALKWDDIDFTAKTININKNVYIPRGKHEDYILQTPKTKTSKRVISVTENVLQELIRLRSFQKQEQMLHRSEWHYENFVFTAPKNPGYPINPMIIWNRMKKSLAASGLNTTLSPHSLRHTHTSLLAEAGVSLEAIMERLGHANDVITKTIYLHITQETKKDAAQKFYELMDSISG